MKQTLKLDRKKYKPQIFIAPKLHAIFKNNINIKLSNILHGVLDLVFKKL